MVETARIFSNGGSQAVRLPKDCRFNADEVLVQKIGNVVMLVPKDNEWAGMLKSLNMFSEDFMEERGDNLELEKRESL